MNTVGAILYFIVKVIALPPGLLVALGLAGLALRPRYPRLGLILLGAVPLLTWVLSMPLFAAVAARSLENFPALDPGALVNKHVDAIVVLAGGAYSGAQEFGGAGNVRRLTLERLRYAAHLYRLTGLPVAVSGGLFGETNDSEAALMQRALKEDFGVPVAAIEDDSINTAENAMFSRLAFPYRSILLVTHAVHMQRAKAQFEHAGFDVIPAPLGFLRNDDDGYSFVDFVPTLPGLEDSRYVLYEAAGALWYRYAYD